MAVSFDRIAPHYRWLETIAFGTALQRARIFFVSEAATARRVLIVGEGNGRFLLELLKQSTTAQVDCVDSSAAMLDLARRRIARNFPDGIQRVQFIHSTIEDWPLPAYRYDLIVTHFFLDCFPEPALAGVIKKLAGAAAENGRWLLADFCVPHDGMARVRARSWLAAMYLFFRLTARIDANELIDPTPILQSEGFELARHHFLREGMLKSELWRRQPAIPNPKHLRSF